MRSCSLVIRAKNEEPGLTKLLAAVLEQTRQPIEIIVVDSGSTDNTVGIARKYGCQVIEIPPESFTYGGSLNTGVRAASGDIIVTISAHCLPKNKHWIDRIVAPFETRPMLAGVFGRQIPFANASPTDRRGLQEAFPHRAEFQLRNRLLFSNASSAFTKEAWTAHPFSETLPYAEDIEWCRDVRKAGYEVGYEPRSVVFHSHEETLKDTYNRFYQEALGLELFNAGLYKRFGMIGGVLRIIKASFLDWVFILQKTSGAYRLKWLFMTPIFRTTVYYGKYKAYKFLNREK